MKPSTEAALLITGALTTFIVVPILIINYYHLLLLVIVICLYSTCLGLVVYFGYKDLKEYLEFKKYEFESVTARFNNDPEKLRWYKFFRDYFGV